MSAQKSTSIRRHRGTSKDLACLDPCLHSHSRTNARESLIIVFLTTFQLLDHKGSTAARGTRPKIPNGIVTLGRKLWERQTLVTLAIW
jgi:hypothetical protein